MDVAAQLPLNLELPDTASLEGYVGQTNGQARAAVADQLARPSGRIFLHGPSGSGKTHLLQAACRAASEGGARAVYVPLAQLGADAAVVLGGLDALDCACLDDIEAIAGNRPSELAVIGLIDALGARRGRMFFADRLPPGALSLAYPDLASRLGAGGALGLNEPSDDDKMLLLKTHARRRGLTLPGTTARWLLNHEKRGIANLIAALDRLDRAALAARRRLTIPFVKQVLNNTE